MNALRQLQKHIRGAGLAYGASIEVDEEAGLTSFKVWRSPDAYKALKAAGDVVRGLADGSVS
jgi:Zn-dependent M16 (insulinase) family peptidase